MIDEPGVVDVAETCQGRASNGSNQACSLLSTYRKKGSCRAAAWSVRLIAQEGNGADPGRLRGDPSQAVALKLYFGKCAVGEQKISRLAATEISVA